MKFTAYITAWGWCIMLQNGNAHPLYLVSRRNGHYKWSLDYAHARGYTYRTAVKIVDALTTDSGVPK